MHNVPMTKTATAQITTGTEWQRTDSNESITIGRKTTDKAVQCMPVTWAGQPYFMLREVFTAKFAPRT